VNVVVSATNAVITAIAGVVIRALFLPDWEDEEAPDEVDLVVDEDEDEDPET
jgi:hypothetical protein